MMAHPIIWLEMSAQDRGRAAAWYADLFGWSVVNNDAARYSTFESGPNAPAGGFAEVGAQYPAGSVIFYIQTDNVAQHLARIGVKGGQTILPATQVPGVGTIGLFRDPTGNVLGLMTPIPR